MSEPRDVDWRVLTEERPAAYVPARNLVLVVNGALFLCGVLTLNLTSGLALVVPAALLGAWLLAVVAGLVCASRRCTRVTGRGLLAGAVGALALEVGLATVLLAGWLANNSH